MEENKKLRQSKSSLKIVLRFGQPRGDLFFITLATKEIKDINQLRIGSTLFSIEHITFPLAKISPASLSDYLSLTTWNRESHFRKRKLMTKKKTNEWHVTLAW